MRRILVVGELNVDLVLHGIDPPPAPGCEVLAANCALTLGSASAICAVALAKLGNRVSFVSTIGCDAYGAFCLLTLQHEGLDVSRVTQNQSLTTGITVSISSGKDRSLITYLGASTAQTDENIDDEWLATFDHLHVSSYFLQAGVRPVCRRLFARASSFGLTTSLDPGFDPSQTWRDDLIDTLEVTDVFLPNEVELMAITRAKDHLAGLRMLENGRTISVVKLGADGCLTLRRGEPVHVSAFPIDVVDTTGAGDSFNAGFLNAWLGDAPLAECLRQAAACGALSTRGLGGVGGQPTEAQLQEFLQKSS